MFDTLLTAMGPQVHTFIGSDVVTVAFAMSKAGHQAPAFASRLMRRGMMLLPRLKVLPALPYS